MRLSRWLSYPELPILASAVLLWFAFWTDAAWFLIAIVLLPFYAVVDRLSLRRAVAAAALFVAFGALIIGFPLLTFQSVRSVALSSPQFYLLLSIAAGYLIFLAALAIPALILPFFLFRDSRLRILSAVLFWIGFEALRTFLSFGISWGLLGEPLISFPPLAAYARLGGMPLLSSFVIAGNFALFESLKFFLYARGARRFYPLAMPALAVAAVILGGWIFLGPKTSAGGKILQVAILQAGSIDPKDPPKDWVAALWQRSRKIARPEDLSGADLVVLPGNYYSELTRDKFESANILEELFGSSIVPAPAAAIGFPFRENGLSYQALGIISPGKHEFSRKEILFPFVDFTPPFFARLASSPKAVSSGYTAGENHVLFLADGLPVGLIGCSEEFSPKIARRLVKEGAQVLLVLGHVGDFRSYTAYRASLRAARLRAVENNVWVIQGMKNGISAFIDPDGRVISSLGRDEYGVLRAAIAVQ